MVLKFRNINTSDWSPSWKSSKQPRKQRKYLINAPLHIRRKILSSNLSKEIREIIKIRSLPVIVGDEVEIMRGKFKGKKGKIIYVDTRKYRVYLDIAYREKSNGEKAYYPIHPSKLKIVRLNLTDKRRIEVIKRKNPNLKDDNIKKLMSISITDKNDLKNIYDLNKSFK